MRPLYINDMHNGIQNIYKFPNGYGASVVQHDMSYGSHDNKWELAVIYFYSENQWDIVYDTPITDDVVGWLDMMQVMEVLLEIEQLPERATQDFM